MLDTEIYCAMTEKLHTLQYLLFSTLATKTDIETLRTGLSNITSQGLKMAITIITLCLALYRMFMKEGEADYE